MKDSLKNKSKNKNQNSNSYKKNKSINDIVYVGNDENYIKKIIYKVEKNFPHFKFQFHFITIQEARLVKNIIQQLAEKSDKNQLDLILVDVSFFPMAMLSLLKTIKFCHPLCEIPMMVFYEPPLISFQQLTLASMGLSFNAKGAELSVIINHMNYFTKVLTLRSNDKFKFPEEFYATWVGSMPNTGYLVGRKSKVEESGKVFIETCVAWKKNDHVQVPLKFGKQTWRNFQVIEQNNSLTYFNYPFAVQLMPESEIKEEFIYYVKQYLRQHKQEFNNKKIRIAIIDESLQSIVDSDLQTDLYGFLVRYHRFLDEKLSVIEKVSPHIIIFHQNERNDEGEIKKIIAKLHLMKINSAILVLNQKLTSLDL
jgi:hypothetical protein